MVIIECGMLGSFVAHLATLLLQLHNARKQLSQFRSLSKTHRHLIAAAVSLSPHSPPLPVHGPQRELSVR